MSPLPTNIPFNESAPKTPKYHFHGLQFLENQWAFSEKFRQKRLFGRDSFNVQEEGINMYSPLILT